MPSLAAVSLLAAAWQTSPHRVGRRQFIAASGLLAAPARAAHAFPPPVGEAALLLPLLQCQAIIAEQADAIRAARGSSSASDWRDLQPLLNQPPFSEPNNNGKGAAVGSRFKAASEAYDASLRYTAEID